MPLQKSLPEAPRAVATAPGSAQPNLIGPAPGASSPAAGGALHDIDQDILFADDLAARDLALTIPPLVAGTRCGEVAETLAHHLEYPALAVVDDDGAPIGLVVRTSFMSALAMPYGREIWNRKTIFELMDAQPLIVDAEEKINNIGRRIAEEAPKALSDGFIITRDGDYLGIGTAVDFLRHSVAQGELRSSQLDKARMAAVEASIAALEASEAKTVFLANMSHEIRTPLNGVLANLELLKFTQINQEQRELVASAEVAAQTLLEIIGDVLDLSKIEAGKLDIEMVAMEPARVLAEVATLLRSKAQQSGVALLVHVAPDVPRKIVGDPLRLRQILMNHASNSLKFTRSGAICLRLTRTEGDATRCRLRFEVSDTGIGFDPNIGDRLFGAFEQADDSTTRRFGGTGLGLAICKRLVELMGGRIRNDGLPGGGASFWFTLPVRIVAQAPNPDIERLAGCPVLLLLPAGTLRDRLTEELRALGAAPYCAQTADEALPALDGGADAPRLAVVALEALTVADHAATELACRLAAELPALILLPGDEDDLRLRRRMMAAGLPLALPWPQDATSLIPWLINMLGPGAGSAAAANDELLPPAPMTDLVDLRILVLEDTPMNQQVVRRQLGRLGLSCEIVENGARGLERATTENWDLVISDCQMPEMDGYEFTRRWRAHEAITGRQRIPVIAMTANATAGESERCRAAGMDDYVVKPVRIERLAQAIRTTLDLLGGERLVRSIGAGPVAAPPAPTPAAPVASPPSGPPAIDLREFQTLTGIDDHEILADLLGFFTETFPELLERIDAAIAESDRPSLRLQAHAAKGAARNAAAGALGDCLEWIERSAANADFAALQAECERAKQLYCAVDTAISAFLQGT